MQNSESQKKSTSLLEHCRAIFFRIDNMNKHLNIVNRYSVLYYGNNIEWNSKPEYKILCEYLNIILNNLWNFIGTVHFDTIKQLAVITFIEMF